MHRLNNEQLYRAIIRLYPRAHRQEYGEQMLQTFDDLLEDSPSSSAVWARVVVELPRNLVEEHIHNLKGVDMKISKFTNRKIIVAVGVFGIIAVSSAVFLLLTRHGQYEPTTLAKVPRAANPPACVQKASNPNLSIPADDWTFIDNVVTTSIIDVPAGTNVNTYLQAYDGTDAKGTAIYSGDYGAYNFDAKKVANNDTNDYVGGWQIVQFEACSR